MHPGLECSGSGVGVLWSRFGLLLLWVWNVVALGLQCCSPVFGMLWFWVWNVVILGLRCGGSGFGMLWFSVWNVVALGMVFSLSISNKMSWQVENLYK